MIDWKVFNSFLGTMEKDQVINLIDTFLNSYLENLEKLKTAVANKNYKGVDDIAHPMKTNCHWFGAMDAEAKAFSLELMGKKKLDDRMDEVLPGFVTAVDELAAELILYKQALK